MAFIPEDGTGLADATSLTDIATADAYHLVHLHAETWVTADGPTKEAALQRATMLITTMFDGRWKGTIKSTTQALPFPRLGLYDPEGRIVSDSLVPTGVQYAVAEVARLEIDADQALAADSGAVSSKTVGPLSLDYAVPAVAKTVRETAMQFLRPYLLPGKVIRA